MTNKKELKRLVEEILKGLPPEITEFFLEDLAEIVPLIKDDSDNALIDATKEIIQIYFRTDISTDEYKGLFKGVHEDYSEEKPDYDINLFKKV